ncbi:MAG: hypothetical protein A2Z96_07475 [Spirochaetes bacterium GWB1_48_6]|nr:MAG: hypothetical protein A2Z96_07475 [Spirochaetes bacterium GWB1_48_6]
MAIPPPGTGRNKKNLPTRVYLASLGIFILFAAGLWFLPYNDSPSERTFIAEHLDAQGNDRLERPLTLIPKKPEVLEIKKKTLYFVIDDAGHNLTQLQKFLDFPGKITIAVIPDLAYTKEASKKILEAGKALILHMPMEALRNDAGADALRVGDDEITIRSKLKRALDQVVGAHGMNNHMGSKATADIPLMTEVFRYLKENNLFFLDSLTNSQSVATRLGREMNYTVGERDVFLDNEKTQEFILQAIEEGKKTADQKGHAVMIGHVWTSELAEVLTEIYPQLLDEGYTLDDLPHLFALPVDDDSTGN